jgi:hypothetical protein
MQMHRCAVEKLDDPIEVVLTGERPRHVRPITGTKVCFQVADGTPYVAYSLGLIIARVSLITEYR